MKMQKSRSRFLSAFLSVVMTAMMLPVQELSAATVITENKTGSEDGYDYELWKDTGTTSMTLTGGGTFSCEWSNINNALFRKGQKFDCTQTYKELGNIEVQYDVDYNPNGNSYLCVYGWTKEPLVEYYIVESWGTWRPPGATAIDTITVDGGTYDVYHTIRENQPSIIGETTFDQYWSVRTDKKTSGTISVDDHFAAWEALGLPMGKMYEVALCVEGYQSQGSATVKQFDILVGGEQTTQPTTEAPAQPDPDASGYYFYCPFESGMDSWTVRGEDSVERTQNAAYAGRSSLYVSGRTDAWNGAGYTLSTSTFQPGNAYSFSVMVMQNEASSEDFKLSLQYDLNGEANYATVAEGSGAKGEWIQLENTAFTIPSGASNLLLYVETNEGLTSFYMDEAMAAPKGTAYEGGGTVSGSGDINKDSTTNVTDIIALQKWLLGQNVTISNAEADLDNDGSVTAFDLAILKKGILTGFWDRPAEPETEPTTEPTTDAPEYVEGQWYNTADISWIDTSKPMVALSFDDGPVGTASSDTSIRIQDAISKNGFHATFFYWGNFINGSNEAEITRAHELGFEVANHTMSHPYLTNLSAAEVQNEINSCKSILTRLTGRDNFLIRPPYLSVNSTVQANAGAPLITCSVDSADWSGATAQDMINKIVAGMNDGSLDNSIVLMHETYTSTAEAVEYLAPYMKQQGWQIVTVSELFKANGKVMYDGQIYGNAR